MTRNTIDGISKQLYRESLTEVYIEREERVSEVAAFFPRYVPHNVEV